MAIFVSYQVLDGVTAGKFDPIRIKVRLVANENTS